MRCNTFRSISLVIPCLIIILLIITALFPFTVDAQIDSALGYFPLNTGDIRQYHYYYSYHPDCGYPPHSSYVLENVLGDTILGTGFSYKIFQTEVKPYNGQQICYLRIDSATANVYMFDDYPAPHDGIIESLKAVTDNSFMFMGEWYKTRCVSVDTLTYLGVQTIAKLFLAGYIFGAEYQLAYGLGRIRHKEYFEDPCYPVLDAYCFDLIYAKINGQEYGTYVDVDKGQNQFPLNFGLAQNFPNPFNPITAISFRIPAESFVSLKIYDVIGREVSNLVSEELSAGEHTYQWNAANMASGIYFYRLQAGPFMSTKKLILLK